MRKNQLKVQKWTNRKNDITMSITIVLNNNFLIIIAYINLQIFIIFLTKI